MSNINNVEEFNSAVSAGVSFVKFGAEWCGPCKLMEKTIAKLEAEFINVNFIMIDIDSLPDIAKQFQIKSIPTMIVFKAGSELKRIVGTSLIEPLRSVLKTSLA